MNEHTNEEQAASDPLDASGLGYPGALPLDVEKYLPYVEDFDMSEEKKLEFLHTLWSIMSAFVDLGWGVDTVQNFIPALKEFSSQESNKNANLEVQSCGPEFMKAADANDEKGNDHD